MDAQGNSLNKRDVRMDNAKGILIILVVVGHFLLPLYQTRFVTNVFYTIYFFHMPFFVFISGYFAKGIVKNGVIRWKKILNILWLYLIYEVLVYFTEGLLEGHFGLPDPFHESGAPWYLLALFIWYVSLTFFKNCKTIWMPAALTLAVIAVKYLVHPGDFLALDRVLSFAPFFYAGYILKRENLNQYLKSGYSLLLSIIAFAILLFIFIGAKDLLSDHFLIVYGADFNRYSDGYQKILWFSNLVWYAGAMAVIYGLIRIIPSREMPVISKLGRNTLQVYMLHRPLRDLLQYAGLYGIINPHQKIQVFLLMAGALILTVLLGNNQIKKVSDRIQIK